MQEVGVVEYAINIAPEDAASNTEVKTKIQI